MSYQNEHLWIYYAGHGLILLCFFSALYGVIASYFVYRLRSENWKQALQLSFWSHLITLFGAISLILYMMTNHYYEFEYVWSHVSDDLPQRYILSAFWEGQEGSFLLWLFWNVLLAGWFIRKKNTFHQTIAGIILAVNVILCSMLLGIYIGSSKIGSNPFQLLRFTMDVPLFANAEYTQLLKGNGLNPLLQNYWMIIHPPTLFLGFASTLIPFAFACSILLHPWESKWFRESLPWALFSASVLGLGILMGGAWAYEALSFGGYWAWDPVENMSLAPWLILVAGIHTNLIANSTEHSIKPTILFYLLSFMVVCYSSFLTRSGILGDSSAHAFTQMGLEWQLVGLCLTVTLIPFYLFFKKQFLLPIPNTEEQISSKEFWIFIGSLVLFFSALLIAFTTSIPVYNKMLDFVGGLLGKSFKDLHRSIPLDPISHHNQFQIWIAILIAFLSGITLYLRYRKTSWHAMTKRTQWAFIVLTPVSLALAAMIQLMCFDNLQWSHFLFLWSAWFAVLSSGIYLILEAKNNFKLCTSALAHGGFGILLLGILFTGINKTILSSTPVNSRDGALDAQQFSKHSTLVKNEPVNMNSYRVVYEQDTFVRTLRSYQLSFNTLDSNGKPGNDFTLNPQIQYDNKLTKVAASNPSIQRFVHKDIFALVAQIPPSQVDATSAKALEDSLKYISYTMHVGDSLETESFKYYFRNISFDFKPQAFDQKEVDQMVQLHFDVLNKESNRSATASPAILFRQNLIYKFPYKVEQFGLRFTIPDSLYNLLVPEYASLPRKSFALKLGKSYQWAENSALTLVKIERDAPSDLLKTTGADLGVTAWLELQKAGQKDLLKAYFLLKGNQIISYPESSIAAEISLRFTGIDPKSEEMQFEYVLHPSIQSISVPVAIAENDARTNYIVVQVIEFPWINLVWLGSLLMVCGLGLASWNKRKY